MNASLLYLSPALGVCGLLFALFLAQRIDKMDPGTDRMKEIASYIQEGAMAFLRRQYRAMIVFVAVLAVIITFGINLQTALCFINGAFFLPWPVSSA